MRVLAVVSILFAVMLTAGAAQAQTICTVTASASRSDTNVSGSGTLAHLRVLESAGASDIYDATAISADANPAAPAFACASATLGAVPRFTGIISNGTNNRVNLGGAGIGFTFVFDTGGTLSKAAGSTVLFYAPSAGQTSRQISGSGTLTLAATTSQYAAGSHVGSIDIGHGNTATAGRDTNSTYSITVTVVPAPTITSVSPPSGSATGGASVTIAGSGFSASGNAVTFGGTTATITAQSTTSITVTTPAKAAGAVNVVVTNADGESATETNGYTYCAAPTVTTVAPPAGATAGGTSVTITGTSLSGATAVTFGGVAGTITANTATSITVTTPAGTGVVNVAVTTAGGTATASNAFSYVNAPTITTVAPGAGPAAGGAGVTITGTNLSGATAVTFGGVAGTITANTATSISVTAPSGTGAVSVAVTTAGGTATATNAYTYVAAPTIASVAPATGPAAGGTGVTITGTNLTDATGVTFGGVAGTITANTATSISVTTPAGAGLVGVAVTTTGGTATATNAYTYVAVLAVTPGAATGATVGGSYSQANPASGGTAPYTYAVASGALPAGTSVNPATGAVTGTPTTAGAYSYAIQATDSQGTPVTAAGATVAGSIAKASQTITFAALSNASLSASPLTLSATSSSGLTVAFTSATTPVCTVSGTTLTLVTTGTCTINADQAGDANYNAATQIQRSFTVTPAALTVTPGAASGATVGGSYSQANPASGGTAPYTYAVASGALPGGTTLNAATGSVTGVVTTAGAYSYAIQATDSQGTPVTATGATVAGSIAKAGQTITFAALSNASLSASPLTLSATSSSGLAVTFTSATTPVCTVSGMTLTLVTTGTCTINADQAGDANYNAATQVQRSFTVTPVGLSVTPGAATGATVGGSYSQANPASGGTAPYTYAVASGALPAGTSVNPATGAVTGTLTTAGAYSYAIQATDSQGTPVTATGATVAGSIAKANQTITFAALANASLSASPLTLSATSSSGLAVTFSSATTGVCTVSGSTLTLLTTGTCTINADQAGDANYNAATQVQRSFTVTPAALTVTPGAATGATVGGSYSQANPASGGTAPYTYAVASGALPAGTSVNPATGAVTGTPTTAGAYIYAIQATDSQGTPVTATGATVAGSIAKASQTITFAALSNASLSASPLTLSATSSSGLAVTFSSATTGVCTVSGTTLTLLTTGTCTINADQAGNATYDAATQVQRSFTVTPTTLIVMPGAATGATVGGSYSQANPASGGTAPYTYALASGALPAGTSVNATTGAVTGTPTTAGAYSYAIQATDSQGTPVMATGATVAGSIAKGSQAITFTALANASLSASPLTLSATSSSGLAVTFSSATTGVCTVSGTTLTLLTTGTCTINADQAGNANYNAATQVQRSFTVTPTTLIVTSGAATGASVGGAFSQSNTASSGVAPYAYTLASGALPVGTSLNAGTGVVTGAPTTAGPYSYAVQATDSAGAPATATGAAVTGSIAKGDQTITFAPLASASLSASPLTLVATSSSGQTVTFSSTTPGVCAVAGTTLTLLTPGTCTINADRVGDANYNAAPQVQRSFTVTAATLVVSPTPASGATVGGSYSQANPASGGTAPYTYAVASGALPAGTSVNPATGAVTGTPTTAGAYSYAIQATDSQGTPVTAAGATVAGSIAKASQTIAFAALSNASLSASPLTLSATSSSGLAVVFTSATTPVCTVSGTTLTLVTTGTCTINADQAGDANYNAAPQVQRSFTVTAATLVVSPTPASGATVGGSYSQANPASGGTAPYTYAVASGALPAGTSVNPATGAVTGVPTTAGAYIYAIQATDSQGTPVTATGATVAGSIAKASQTITFAALSNASLSASPLMLSATSSSGLAVTFSSATTGVCTVSGTTLTLLTTGTCTINADQTGNATYDAATQVQRSFTVTPLITPPAPTVANRSGISVAYNTATTIDLTASVSGAYASVAVATPPAHGSVSFRGAVATYTPTAGSTGPDSFTYTATGPGGTSAPGTVTLTIATPPAPIVTPPPPPPTPDNDGSFSIDLVSNTANPVSEYRITANARFGSGTIEAVDVGLPIMMQAGGGRLYRLRYRPVPAFMGTDTVTVVAIGPGGDSAPAVFTFNVAGKAPDLTARAPANGSVTISPTAGIVGGPFQGLRITRQPAFGTATVSGQTIVFTPGAANAGPTSLDYVVVLSFGTSAAGRIDLQSDAVPVVPVITAVTPAGRPVTVSLTANAQGGPFTAAAITSLSVPAAGTAVLVPGGSAAARTYDLTFTPAGAFTGRVDVAFTLSNAAATSTGVVQITVQPRPDPVLDPDVRGLISSQADAARRFARAQTDNFNQRLEQIRDGDNQSASTLSVNMNLLDALTTRPDLGLQQRIGVSLDSDGLTTRDRANRAEERAFFDRSIPSQLTDLDDAATDAEVAGAGRSVAADGTSGARPSRVGVWAGGTVDWGRRDAQGLRDTRFRTSGLSAGLDMKITDALILGGGIGYGDDHASIGELGTVSDGQSTVGVVYGSWRASSDLHLSGMIGHGGLDYDTRRWSTNAAAYALGERAGSMTFASLGLAYDRRAGRANQSVYGRMEASEVSLDAFSETGAGIYALSYEALDARTLTSNLGFRMDWVIQSRDSAFMPSVRMEWRHEFEQPGEQGVTYADWLASPRYGVDLQGWSRDSVSLDLGGRWVIDERIDLTAGYRTTVGSNASSQGLQLKLMTRF